MEKHLFTLISLSIAYQSVAQLTISPVFGEKPITEDTWFITKNKDSIQFDKIRFYLSDIQFEMEDKSLIKDTVKAHLVDVFEVYTLKINFKKLDFKKIKMIQFNIGIDSLTNVSGALGGDLDPQKGMYWAWQSGYINTKIEGRSPQCKNRKNTFQFHIGGYLQPFYAIRRVEMPVNAFFTEGVSDVGNFPTSDITNPTYTEGVILKLDVSKFFENIQIVSQNSIMMPCNEAMQLADHSTSMFSIYVPKN